MNPEAQRIAIAEACGWKYVEGLDVPSLSYSGARKCGDCWVCPKRGAGYGEYEPPNYLTNLNAMREAEDTLTTDQLVQQAEWIGACSSEMHVKAWVILLRATAAQRAEAFLRVIGKWQDE